jgi:putative transmembrane protein PGPGW
VDAPLLIVVGIAMIAVGLAGLVLPGPGLVGLAIGFALLSRESLLIAKGMDGAEVRGRALWSRSRHRAA